MAQLVKSTLGFQFDQILKRKDNGIHKAFMYRYRVPSSSNSSGVDVTFEGSHSKRNELMEILETYRGEGEIEKLLPFQIECILNSVFRPTRINVEKKIIYHTRTHENGQREDVTFDASGKMVLEDEDDDIGMVVTNDLFTGSGKTLTSITSALAFSNMRKESVKNRIQYLMREQMYSNWGTRVNVSISGVSRGVPVYSDIVVIMTAKHLISQWSEACQSANEILGLNSSIFVNPLSQSVGNNTSETSVFIIDSFSKLTRLGLKFVPMVIVDEFVVKSNHNIMTRVSTTFPIYGRLLLVSADAGSIATILSGVSRKSMFRKIIGADASEYSMGMNHIMLSSIPIISTAVLPTHERTSVRSFMVSQLDRISYEEYTVNYTPTFSSRLFGGNFEMSAMTGKQAIKSQFGIDIKDSSSIGEILDSVKDSINRFESMTRRDTNYPGDRKVTEIKNFYNKLVSFIGEKESCPICLDDYTLESSASLIDPCWHIICSKCMKDIVDHSISRCPMCRTDINGHATASIEPKPIEVKKEVVEEIPNNSESLIDNINRIVDSSMGLEKACIQTLRCLQTIVGDSTYRIIMVVPNDHFYIKFQQEIYGVFEENFLEILQFKTIGTKRKRVTVNSLQHQLNSFSSETGPKMKILFTTEGHTDSLTGLDFPDVDCIFSLGHGNTIQRLGRLTRLPRALKETSRNKIVRCISMTHV